MNKENSRQLLSDPEQIPSDELFMKILYEPFVKMMKKIFEDFDAKGFCFEWKYYNDGKAWLGKTTFRNKTLVWISLWEHCIKAGFYFTEKTRPDILNLDISENTKSLFARSEPIGKLIPLTVDIKDEESLQDFTIILNHKKILVSNSGK